MGDSAVGRHGNEAQYTYRYVYCVNKGKIAPKELLTYSTASVQMLFFFYYEEVDRYFFFRFSDFFNSVVNLFACSGTTLQIFTFSDKCVGMFCR